MTRFTPDPKVLRRLPPFSWLTDAQIKKILPFIQYRSYAPRTFILEAGSEADGLYIILYGNVRLLHLSSAGREFCSAVIGANEFFGELNLFEPGPSPASFQTMTDCQVLYIPYAAAIECLERNARASMCMLRKIVTRLNQAHHTMTQLALTTVYQRVARLILDHSYEVDGESCASVGSEQMARLAGASREMVTRVIATLIAKNIVRRQKRALIVVDPAALAVFAEKGRVGRP